MTDLYRHTSTGHEWDDILGHEGAQCFEPVKPPPAVNMALTIAKTQIEEGREVGDNTAATIILWCWQLFNEKLEADNES